MPDPHDRPAPDVRQLRPTEFELVLPLIADYQRFYGVRQPSDARNREFFSRFLAPSDDGALLAAWLADEPGGYACLYWSFSSITPAEVVVLNDLFVVAEHRGAGIGRALIATALALARERGAAALRWQTAPDNARAQRLYDSLPAERSTWFEYELSAAP